MANAMYLGSSGMMNSGLPGVNPSPAPTAPIRTANEPALGGMQVPPNEVGPQAVRASGPSAGYDPSYLQNLSSFIGSLFAKPAGGGNTTSFNPLGNLNDISPPGEQIGNAPNAGSPMTWLQQALNGGGFSFTSPAPAASTHPIRQPIGTGDGNRGRGPRNPILV